MPKALVEYVPIEFAAEPVEGGTSLFINCIWVVPVFKRMASWKEIESAVKAHKR